MWVRAIIAGLGVVLLMIIFAVLTTDSDDLDAAAEARDTATTKWHGGDSPQTDGGVSIGGVPITMSVPTPDASLHDRSSYEVLDSRDLAFIVKDPTQHLGRKVVLHGYVQQFDTATGLDTFLASVDAVPHSSRFEYRDRALISSSTSETLAEVVQGDLVTMYVTVGSPTSYTATTGSRVTVPTFTAQIVEVTGHSG